MVKSVLVILAAVVVGIGFVFVSGCDTAAGSGSVIGGLAGAGVGQLAGGHTEGTLIGAAVGTGAGYLIGNEMDKKKATKESDNIQAQQNALRAEQNNLSAQQNTVTVWVTNTNSSKIPVTLTKDGPGYIGPRHERYDHLPTSEELKMVYGF